MKKIKGRFIIERGIRKKVFKFFVLGVVVLKVISSFNYVEAGMNDSSLEKNRMEGIYAIAMVNGQQHLYYLNMYQMNSRVAYCINIGVDITTNIYHSTADFSISYLSSEQIEYIRSISYFGYQYAGHGDYRYYMAAQEIIWEYLSNGSVDVQWTNELNVNGTKINIDSYKNEILQLRTSYYYSVTFDWIDGQVYSIGQEISLIDVAQVLSNYEVISTVRSKAWIDGNRLNIQVSDDYVGRESIVLRKKEYYSYDSLLYYYDASQKLISNGNFKTIERKLYFYVKGVSLCGQVVDKKTGENVALGDASLEGAVYELYNEDRILLGKYVSDMNGRLEVNNLPSGTYYLKQIEASEGYLINEQEVLVELGKESQEVILEQEIIANLIELRKVHEKEDGKYLPEASITFSIYSNDGEFYQEVVTNEEGCVTIWLPYGTYLIHQANTSLGYTMIDDFVIDVKEEREEIISYQLINYLVRCRVKIYIFEEESKSQILSNEFGYRVKRRGEEDYLSVDGQDVFKTNENGELLFPMLFSFGDYILEMVEGPNEVVLQSEEIIFTIGNQTNFEMENGDLMVKLDIFCPLVKGRVNVLFEEEVFHSEKNQYGYYRVAKENEELVLVAKEDIFKNGEKIYHKDDEIVRKVTNKEGKLSIGNLSLGSYCLFSRDSNQQQCFELKSDTGKEDYVEVNIFFMNSLDKADLVLKNVSEVGDNIIGTVFEIFDKDNVVIYRGITNEEGIVKISNLLYGIYCISQESISNEYQLIHEKKCVQLNESREVEYINQKVKKKLFKVPDTFSDGNSLLKLGIMFILGIGVVGYKKIFSIKFFH